MSSSSGDRLAAPPAGLHDTVFDWETSPFPVVLEPNPSPTPDFEVYLVRYLSPPSSEDRLRRNASLLPAHGHPNCAVFPRRGHGRGIRSFSRPPPTRRPKIDCGVPQMFFSSDRVGREWCSLRGRGSEKGKLWSLHRYWRIGGQLAAERFFFIARKLSGERQAIGLLLRRGCCTTTIDDRRRPNEYALAIHSARKGELAQPAERTSRVATIECGSCFKCNKTIDRSIDLNSEARERPSAKQRR